MAVASKPEQLSERPQLRVSFLANDFSVAISIALTTSVTVGCSVNRLRGRLVSMETHIIESNIRS